MNKDNKLALTVIDILTRYSDGTLSDGVSLEEDFKTFKPAQRFSAFCELSKAYIPKPKQEVSLNLPTVDEVIIRGKGGESLDE